MNRWNLAVVLGVMVVAGMSGALAQTVVIDETDPACTLEGVWADNASNGYGSGGCMGNVFHYTSNYAPFKKTGRERAVYTPGLPTAGNWKVEVSYRCTENRSSKVTYEVKHADGAFRTVVNQRKGKDCTWVSLGIFRFEAGKGGSVILASDGGSSASTDAVRFTLTDEPVGGVDGGTSSPGGGSSSGGSTSAPDGPGAVRLTAEGTATYTFTADGTVTVSALLQTYGQAKLTVDVTHADGSTERFMSWVRRNDTDGSPLALRGQPVNESMYQPKAGDWSPKASSHELAGKAGDKVTLTLEGDFGAASPYLVLVP